ncbi:hypothetical protein GALMADRAFT_131762 [Galerina marginata CBS 339.88]|uniref:Protein CPL1-like domain-containing protein n=1 Tax=Galerina marginata (strain CBS 339.88) TaxID=685588 RepID=A0A067TRT4_GALM3|nr:hypothetical protein GALMADRAFT_131762 [Galerina marginata CBS 339.88]
MQLKFVLTVLAALVPLAVSTSVGSKSCKPQEFWYKDKECCLPTGGPPKPPPSPPKGTQCPPTSHYWGEKQGCCVPRNPPPSNPPPPQCPKGWTWYPSLHHCRPTPTPPTPPPSHPSGNPGSGGYNHHNYKRSTHKARASLCPTGLDACPVSGLSGDYECLDTATELESCGGCSTLGKGQDCTAIKGVWNVGCEQGSCKVYTCAGGFQVGADGKSCTPL